LSHATQKAETDWIAHKIAAEVGLGRRRPRDFAIFYRMNALSRGLEHSLRECGIPYQMINGVEFYQRKEIKDILAYLQLINNPRDNVALARIINTPIRGIGKTTIQHINRYAMMRGMTMLDAARQSGLIPELPKRAAVAVAKFVHMFDRLQAVAMAPVEEIMGLVLSETKYEEMLKNSGNEEEEDRLANIQELLTAAREFDEQNPGTGQLEGYLEQASLVNDTDAWEAETDRVTLMTLHAAKGLEFPVVFITAIEEGLLPHERSREKLDQLEEERRLFFVGITRAREELNLTMAKYRSFRGQTRMAVPSPFLMELPTSEMEVQDNTWVEPDWMQFEGDAQADGCSDEPEIALDHGEAHEHEGTEQFDDAVENFDQPDSSVDVDGESSLAGLSSQFRLKTAAELPVPTDDAITTATTAEIVDEPRAAPEDFHHGQLVRHPTYGLGKIISLSGSGTRRGATIAFVQGAGEKRFILAHSKLQPVKGG